MYYAFAIIKLRKIGDYGWTNILSYVKEQKVIFRLLSSITTIRGSKGSFEIKRHFTCQSADVVYAVFCSLCSDSVLFLYMGETYRSLAKRVDEHFRSARLGYRNPVGEHFQRPGHCAYHLSICCVWQNSSESARRKFTEMHFAHKLGTFRPFGMNIRSWKMWLKACWLCVGGVPFVICVLPISFPCASVSCLVDYRDVFLYLTKLIAVLRIHLYL